MIFGRRSSGWEKEESKGGVAGDAESRLLGRTMGRRGRAGGWVDMKLWGVSGEIEIDKD